MPGENWEHALLPPSDLTRTAWLPPSLEIWAVHGPSLVPPQPPACWAADLSSRQWPLQHWGEIPPSPPVLSQRYSTCSTASRDQVLTPTLAVWGVDRIMASWLRVSENSHKGTNRLTNQGIQMGCLLSFNASSHGLQRAFLEYEIEAASVSNINFPISRGSI